jgi:hypothetical protein
LKKKQTNKQTCQWTLILTWLVGFQTNKRTLFHLPNTWDLFDIHLKETFKLFFNP